MSLSTLGAAVVRLVIVHSNCKFEREPTINLILGLNFWWDLVTNRDVHRLKLETHDDIVAVWLSLRSGM